MSGDSAIKSVFCVRNKIMKSADEHLSCPYCFARKREVVESGQRRDFCDWDAEKDPISFGFPDGTSRNLRG